jgi:hypothetical protein
MFVMGSAIAPSLASPVGARLVSDQATDQAGQADESRAAKPKARSPGANRRNGTQIACTRTGCRPIPRGCRIEIERDWDGLPTGFDEVICPYR